MPKPEHEEITAQDEQSSAAASENQEVEALTAPDEGQAEALTSIPEKFRGKSMGDVIQAYQHAEKQMGKIASEKAHSEKAAEELRARIQQMEAERAALLSQQPSQQYQPHVSQQTTEEDPFSQVEELTETDPVAAIKKLASTIKEDRRQVRAEVAAEIRGRDANAFYQRQMQENPDFAALEKDMQRLAMKHSKLIRPEHANTPETIELLYKLARAEAMPRYLKDAEEKAKKASDLVKDEKRRSFSESSQSSNTSGKEVAVEDLSLDELRQLVGVGERR